MKHKRRKLAISDEISAAAINKAIAVISSKLDLRDLVQNVTDAAQELSSAHFAAFFYSATTDEQDPYSLYALSGVSENVFEAIAERKFRAILMSSLHSKRSIRIADISKDYNSSSILLKNIFNNLALSIASYIAVPVISRSGEILGGLFLGHPQINHFSEQSEDFIQGLASQAAIAIDNSRLYQSAQREIAERKLAEKVLQDTQRELNLQQARLQSVIENSADAIITKDLKGIIQSWNKAAEDIFGYKASEVIGRSIRLIIPPELAWQEEEILSKISKGERVSQLEAERLKKSGERIFISITSSPIKDLNGQIIGATKIARDITERRKQRIQIEQSEAHYRELAEERSTLLELESRSRKQVEEANRIKDQFLATLSHELRTPLNAILGWSQLALRRSDDPERIRESLEIIQRNARSQAQIIEDLLDMNRILSGSLKLDLRPISIRRVTDEAIETVLPSAQARNIKIEKIYELLSPTVFADANRLKQIIWNLLTNAIKFSSKVRDEAVIQVTIVSSGDFAKLVIEDQGEGISKDFLPFVFDRFSQADITSSRRFGGLGLGLSIVRYLIELHGGQISAESEGVGKGAKFSVVLPLAQSSQVETRDIKSYQILSESLSPDSLKGLSALVVDDEKDARSLVKSMLIEHGAEVWDAASSLEAIDLLKSKNINLIISDIGMPNEDGYQFIKRVRSLSHDKLKILPAIALTAYARSEDRIIALKSGFQMHVSKPVERSELLAVVTSLKNNKNYKEVFSVSATTLQSCSKSTGLTK